MEHGNLSSVVAPRIVIVFEGAIGWLHDSKNKKYQKLLKKKQWDQAIKFWQLNDSMLDKIWNLYYHKSVNIEVCTWLGKEMAEAIRNLLDENNIPVRDVWASEPARLSRELAYMPDVVTVYDPDPDHVFTFGSKGKLLRSVNEIGKNLCL